MAINSLSLDVFLSQGALIHLDVPFLQLLAVLDGMWLSINRGMCDTTINLLSGTN